MWYWTKERQANLGNIIKSLDIDPHTYGQLNFTQSNPSGKRYSFQQMMLKSLNIPMEKKGTAIIASHLIKETLRQITGINIKANLLNLTEKQGRIFEEVSDSKFS